MKKIILVFPILFAVFTVNAQNTTDFRNRLLLGFKAGVNYSNVYDIRTESFNANPKLGFAGGAFLAIPFGKLIGIQPELLYSQKGFQSSGSILGSNYNITRTSSFLDIPLFFAFKPSEFLTLLAGPQLSYLLKQQNTFKNGSTSATQETEFDNEDVRKNILGASVGVDLTLKHIVLSARAGWDLQKNNSDGSSSILRYRNTWYQATIGYRLYRNR